MAAEPFQLPKTIAEQAQFLFNHGWKNTPPGWIDPEGRQQDEWTKIQRPIHSSSRGEPMIDPATKQSRTVEQNACLPATAPYTLEQALVTQLQRLHERKAKVA